MGRKHAKIISRDAFMQSFVEAEVIMRRNLATRIEQEANKAVEEKYDIAYINGLKKAAEIVFGEVETNDVG